MDVDEIEWKEGKTATRPKAMYDIDEIIAALEIAGYKRDGEQRKFNPPFGGSCYNCGKKRHMSRHCRGERRPRYWSRNPGNHWKAGDNPRSNATNKQTLKTKKPTNKRESTLEIGALVPIKAMTTTRKMTIQVYVGGDERTALIDSGCSALIVAKRVVEEMKLKTQAGEQVAFRFADGRSSNSNEVVDLTIRKGTYSSRMNLHVLEITNDIILGIPFLESVIITHQDAATGRLEFIEKDLGVTHTWEIDGMTAERCVEVITEEKGTGSGKGSDHATSTEKLSEKMYTEYDDIFLAPTELPPPRPEDMEIEIVEGAQMPSNRPLRQFNPETQAIIKSHIEELLEKGYIS